MTSVQLNRLLLCYKWWLIPIHMLLSKVEKGSPEYENIQSDKEQVLAIIQALENRLEGE